VGAAHAVSEAFLEAFRLADGFAPGEVTVLAWLTRLTRQRAEAIAAHRR
jgi:DNA-directed RNA polymerase specialized sigma24 family protein